MKGPIYEKTTSALHGKRARFRVSNEIELISNAGIRILLCGGKLRKEQLSEKPTMTS